MLRIGNDFNLITIEKDGLFMKEIKLVLCFSLVFLSVGCSGLKEGAKVILGTSVKSLEDARVDAIRKTYYCDFDDCFDVILTLDRTGDSRHVKKSLETTSGSFDVFQQDRIKGFIVVMGIQGNVDTTEVGIFLEAIGRSAVEIEVVSLSSSAKRKVATVVFDELDSRFSIKE